MKLSFLFAGCGFVPAAVGQSVLGAAPAAAPVALAAPVLPAFGLLDSQCGIDTSGPICLGDQVLLPPALPAGLVGFWNFDQAEPLDSTGNGLTGSSPVVAGPSFAGRGSSAFFHKTFQMIPGMPQIALTDFSYSFWVYIVEHAGHAQSASHLCPILRKGLESNSRAAAGGPLYASAPAVFYHPESKRLHVEIATSTDDVVGSVEGFESNSRLKKGRWFHIAIVRLDSQRKTRLYVNGILDSAASSNGFTMANREPLYVGGDPVTQQSCDLPMYVDELKVYNRHLTPDEIQAEAAPALAGIEPSFVRLACVDCPLDMAMANCPDGYHICNSLELHMGGYQVARTLGWLGPATHVWSHAPSANAGLQAHGTLTMAAPAQGVPTNASALGYGAFAPGDGAVSSGLGLGICCADEDVGMMTS